MKRIVQFISLVIFAPFVLAQTAPGSDIFIAELESKDGRLQIGQLKNITKRKGYDNQPYFLADGKTLLYTSQIGEQTDIMHFNLASQKTVNLTNSKVSEYSPTPLRNGKEFSVIYATDNNQHLWAYDLTGKTKRPLIQQNFKIGYHAWIDKNQVLITVLQEGFMNLQVSNIQTQQTTTLHPKTGASVFNIPSSQNFSFNTQINEQHWLMQLNIETGNKHQLVELPKDTSYYAWTPDGKVLLASQNKLWFWDSQKADSKLTPFANIQAVCPGGASRMAVNPQQTRLALVCHGESL
ncbi:hypothetical protein [Paraglaciecola aestuariivivens]